MYQRQEERQFLFPFLVGAVTGGAAIGLTRPRPIVNAYPVPPYNPYYYPPRPYPPYYPPYYH